MITSFLPDSAQVLLPINYLLAFVLTAVMLAIFKNKLPQDQGRAYAVNGQLSKGKARGAGLLLIIVFAVCSFAFVPTEGYEYPVYYLCIIAAMLTGYFDDAAEKPWNEYLKGALDLVIALVMVFTYIAANGTTVNFLLIGASVKLPVWLFAILAVILVWVSINVINCTDGVDGLCASLSIVSMLAFALILSKLGDRASAGLGITFIMVLLAYLLFNSHPSTILMGDAGSRAIGLFMAILALKSDPILFVPFCLVFILDGGLGLIKVSLLRFLKIKIMSNIRTPLHDHFRKNKGWSDTQTVFRFLVVQAALAIFFAAILLYK